MGENKVSLTNLLEGAAVEMFDRQLSRVYNNIGDINTDLKTREITLKVKFTPSKDRSYMVINVECPPAKLSGQDMQETTADLRMDEKGRFFARERMPSQMGFGFKYGNVEDIKKHQNDTMGDKNND